MPRVGDPADCGPFPVPTVSCTMLRKSPNSLIFCSPGVQGGQHCLFSCFLSMVMASSLDSWLVAICTVLDTMQPSFWWCTGLSSPQCTFCELPPLLAQLPGSHVKAVMEVVDFLMPLSLSKGFLEPSFTHTALSLQTQQMLLWLSARVSDKTNA